MNRYETSPWEFPSAWWTTWINFVQALFWGNSSLKIIYHMQDQGLGCSRVSTIIFLDGFKTASCSVFSPDFKNMSHFLIGCSNHEIWALIGQWENSWIRVMVLTYTPKLCQLSWNDTHFFIIAIKSQKKLFLELSTRTSYSSQLFGLPGFWRSYP